MTGKMPEIRIDQGKCKGCNLCLELCPKGVFQETQEMGAKGFRLRIPELSSQCSNCGLCKYFCPEEAIILDGECLIDEFWEQLQQIKKVSQARGGWKKVKTLYPGKHFISGNIACVWAALDAGCRFFAGYPITPASEQSYEMERLMPSAGGVFIQMENEDASMAALCGASLAGAKAMTATSDPGFERMLENSAFALTNELPMVVAVVQRTSPSTGRPTGTGSSLVRGVRWGPHGGTEHIVLYPSTVQEIYHYTIKAFNLAERFRSPVILMLEASNTHLEEGVEIPQEIEVFDRIYIPENPPFGPTEDGSAPSMPRFGDGEFLKVSGLTHNERGVPCATIPEVHERMVKHQRRKIVSKIEELTDVEEYLLDDAEIMIIAYGHTARSARWAIKEARKRGMKVGMLNLRTLYPFPEEKVKRWSKVTKCVLVPEMNQGQLFYVVRESSFSPVISLPQPDGEGIDPRRILHFLETTGRKYCQDLAPILPPTIYDPPEWREEKGEIPERNFSPQTIFCPGCGLGTLRNCLLKCIQEMNWPLEKIVVASGIGCTARLPNHLPFDSANTTHGYPIPFATGVKLAQPDLHVIVISGDGDLFDIGAGQTIHGARRNLPILAICFNNFVFGMTGGQVAATTPLGAITSTTTTGNKRLPLDLVRLMLGANAKYVARCPISKPLILKGILKEALCFDGFSFVEVVSPCLMGYGRRNELFSPSQIWQKLNQAYVAKEMAREISETILRKKFKSLFPFREEVKTEELGQIIYGRFSNLKEYVNLVPEES